MRPGHLSAFLLLCGLVLAVAGCQWWPAAAPEGMVLVRAGYFLMGKNEAMFDCEKPAHRVYLGAFYIDRYPVTNAKYKEFCDARGRQYPENPHWDPDYFLSKPDYPVVNVTWYDATEYAAWVGKRLPTEAEWEKAARGPDGLRWPWGNTFVLGRANLTGLTDGYEYTSPVGVFKQGGSPYRVHDMTGNVWEWVQDWFDTHYYGTGPLANPKGPASGNFRVLRGGSYLSNQMNSAPSYRGYNYPSGKSYCIGFRCAADAK